MCNWYLVRTCVWMNKCLVWFGFYSITKHTERVIDIFRQYVGEMNSNVMQNIMDSLALPAIVDGLEFIETWNTPIESNRIILAYSFSCGRHPRWICFFSSSFSLLPNLYSSCILRATCEIHFICFSDYKLIIAFEPSNLLECYARLGVKAACVLLCYSIRSLCVFLCFWRGLLLFFFFYFFVMFGSTVFLLHSIFLSLFVRVCNLKQLQALHTATIASFAALIHHNRIVECCIYGVCVRCGMACRSSIHHSLFGCGL